MRRDWQNSLTARIQRRQFKWDMRNKFRRQAAARHEREQAVTQSLSSGARAEERDNGMDAKDGSESRFQNKAPTQSPQGSAVAG